jgi:hypothetical protein
VVSKRGEPSTAKSDLKVSARNFSNSGIDEMVGCLIVTLLIYILKIEIYAGLYRYYEFNIDSCDVYSIVFSSQPLNFYEVDLNS